MSSGFSLASCFSTDKSLIFFGVKTSSLSARMYEMSLLEHKSLQQYIRKTSAFYNAERCLDKPVDVSKIVSTKSIHTHAARITALVGKNLSWWKNNALPCGENTWVYLQFLWKDALNENIYYRISAYHEKHILLQVVIKIASSLNRAHEPLGDSFCEQYSLAFVIKKKI